MTPKPHIYGIVKETVYKNISVKAPIGAKFNFQRELLLKHLVSPYNNGF